MINIFTFVVLIVIYVLSIIILNMEIYSKDQKVNELENKLIQLNPYIEEKNYCDKLLHDLMSNSIKEKGYPYGTQNWKV